SRPFPRPVSAGRVGTLNRPAGGWSRRPVRGTTAWTNVGASGSNCAGSAAPLVRQQRPEDQGVLAPFAPPRRELVGPVGVGQQRGQVGALDDAAAQVGQRRIGSPEGRERLRKWPVDGRLLEVRIRGRG